MPTRAHPAMTVLDAISQGSAPTPRPSGPLTSAPRSTCRADVKAAGIGIDAPTLQARLSFILQRCSPGWRAHGRLSGEPWRIVVVRMPLRPRQGHWSTPWLQTQIGCTT